MATAGAAGTSGRTYSFKVVLLGEGCVGKTSLVLRYCENKFNDKHITTLQVRRSGGTEPHRTGLLMSPSHLVRVLAGKRRVSQVFVRVVYVRNGSGITSNPDQSVGSSSTAGPGGEGKVRSHFSPIKTIFMAPSHVQPLERFV